MNADFQVLQFLVHATSGKFSISALPENLPPRSFPRQQECERIFNSPEVSETFQKLTNMSHCNYTTADLEPYFKRADKDASGTLSRTEFLALYLAVTGDRVKRNPLLLAEALLGFIDKDKNGVLEGKELKCLLAILGFAPALLLPIPGFMKIEYRAIFKRIGRRLEGGTNKGKA
ncbi:hypothetical protein Vretimale_131 [Volvox reticuliferus]|uniref:EF-hand domain-containing protein n=1 Tax=Volvox reticuliferus TaxID=1737510 RepID=A0A8J4FKH4_9CHLO|nr:hypothetical protein Vretifemale_8268 [Volvox reticuliferus]GIL93905.1 hypothetical protein Vretimale_131 [Volvox reticuliferus]